MHVNKDFFTPNGEDMNDPVNKYFGEKEECRVLIVKSMLKGWTKMFPVVKERANEGSKMVTNVKLIDSEEHTVKIKLIPEAESQDGSGIISNFFCRSDEFGDNKDNYCEITERLIKVYDKEQ